MKKIIATAGLCLLASSALAQSAPEKNPFYLGLSGGQTKIDTGVTGLTGTATLDETDTGFKIFGGLKIDSIWGAELQYVDFGKASLKGNNGDRFNYQGTQYQFTSNNVDVSLKAKSYGVSMLAGYDVSKMFRPFAKVGLHHWKSTESVNSNAGGASLSDSGTDLFYGVGVQFSFTDRVAARLEAEQYKFDSDKVQLISAGLTVSF
ncbi:MAG: porin family protein [Burkholderiaceae bacterium]|nr:porin family protein [Burkholderiaceae bacterium]